MEEENIEVPSPEFSLGQEVFFEGVKTKILQVRPKEDGDGYIYTVAQTVLVETEAATISAA